MNQALCLNDQPTTPRGVHSVDTIERRKHLALCLFRSQIHATVICFSLSSLGVLNKTTLSLLFRSGKCKTLDCNPIVVGGIEDHVHLLTTFGRKLSIAETVKEVKRGSNQWVQNELGIRGFKWQSGYGVFSVSQSQLDVVRQYIENQEQHHASRGFQDEFRMLLNRHELEWDERYVWD